MKRILSFVLAAAMMAISCTKEKENNGGPYNPDGSPITQAQALEIVKEDIDEYDLVYVTKSIVKKGTSFKPSLSVSRMVEVRHDSWIVMIDSDPRANGGQKWLYIYVDAYTGNADDYSWEWGLPNKEKIDFECVKNDQGKYALSDKQSFYSASLMKTKAATSESNNWAVIISGGANIEFNYERYWNDCSEAYKCLRNVYNYRRDRILVLMSDGKSSGFDRHMMDGTYMSSPQDLDGDGTDDINYSATKSNISQVFDYLASHVSSDEQVLIFVTDHGAREDGKSYIWLWNDITMSADDFAKEVKKIPSASRKHVVMGQCYSGGFVSPLMSACSNISIATAASADQESHAMLSLEYDAFLYHWISAAAGRTPNGTIVNADLNGYDGVSTEEMFRYAQNNNGLWSDTPQYASSPSPMGEKYGLSGEEFGYPVFTAESRHLTSNAEGYLFELSNLPRTYTTAWSSNKNSVYFRQNTQSSVRAFKNTEDAMAEDQVKVDLTTSFKTYSFKSDIYLWESGINFTETLIGGSLSGGTFSLPFNCSDVASYEWMIDGVEYEAINSSAHFIDFVLTGEVPEEYAVSVSFENPLGSGTTIVRRFYQ